MAWFSELISTVGRADIANGLVDVSAKAALLLLAALLATYVLRRASASTRHHVWIVAFCSILALPVLTLALPAWQEWGGRHLQVTKIERNSENRPSRLRVDDVSRGDESTVRPLLDDRPPLAARDVLNNDSGVLPTSTRTDHSKQNAFSICARG